MNKVILLGRIVRDPDIRYSQGDNAMCIARFSLACDRKFKRDGEQTADFINCVAFGKTAEVVEKYCHQGTKLVVEGRIQTGSYTNKDGQKVYTTDIAVENLEFAESKASLEQNNSRPEPVNAAGEGFLNIPQSVEEDEPDSLPFDI